jgi:ribosomal protein S18 acetylase RimI-like enzyme
VELNFLKINEINKLNLISIINKYYKKFDDFEKMCDFFNINCAMSFIPGIGEKPIGFFLVSTIKNRAYINNFVILPEFRDKGFGKIALSHGIKNLINNNFNKISLDTLTDNYKALKIYEKYNFKIINQIVNIKASYLNKINNRNNDLIRIEKGESMEFQILYNNFKKNEKPWFAGKNILIKMIENGSAVFYRFVFDKKTIGYSVNDNIKDKLKIFDIFIVDEFINLITEYISLMADGKEVFIRNLYEKSLIIKKLLESSFFIESRQFEMEYNVPG